MTRLVAQYTAFRTLTGSSVSLHGLHRDLLRGVLGAALLLLAVGSANAQCDCNLNMGFERAAGSCFGQDCGCICNPDPIAVGETWSSCPTWGCGSTDIGPNPGGSVNMGNTQPTQGNSFVSMECGGGPAGAGEGISMTMCAGFTLEAGTQYCFALDLITRASFGNNAGTSGLVIYGSNGPCQTSQTLWTLPQATGSWQTYNFCFTPTSNWNTISFRVLNAGGGFSAIGMDNWVSTDGNFPPQTTGCIEVEADGDEICPGECGSVSAEASNGVEPYTYTWSGGLPSGPGPHPVCPTTTTVYTVTVVDANGDTDNTTATVTVFPAAVANAGNDVDLCQGGSTTLGASGGGTYSWSPATGLSSTTIAAPTANPTQTTTYTVTVTNANGCTDTDEVTVTVNAAPVVSAGPDQDICLGNSATLSASGGITYAWSPATGLSATNIATPIATPTQTTTYTVTVTDVNGCTGTDDVIITVLTTGCLDISATGSAICPGACGTVSVTVNDGTGPFNYAWSGGLPNDPGPHPVCPTSTTTYTVTVTDAGGNAATTSAIVTVFPNAQSNAGPDDAICEGGSTQLNGSGGVSYEWNPPDGLSDPQIPNPVASPDATTTYTLTVLDANGCTDTDAMTLGVNTVSGIDAGPDVAICLGGSTTLAASGGVSYSWSPATGLSSTNIANPTAAPTTTTTYTATITDANGCTGTDVVTVTVNTLAGVSAGPDVSICTGASTVLGASGGVSYSWSPVTGLSDPTSATPTASPTATTTYTVTATDANGCSGSDQVTITITTLQTANAGPDQGICLGGSTTLNASGGVSYSWTPGTGLSSTTIAAPVANPTATTTYTVIVTDADGCSGTDAVVITVTPLDFANAGPDQEVCTGTSTSLAASGGISYLWTPSTGLSNPAIANPTVSPSGPITYTVLVTDADGCYDTDQVSLSTLALPTVSLGEDFEACLGQVRLIAVQSQPGQSYVWSTGDTGPIISVSNSGTYEVTASNACGSITDAITVLFVDCDCAIYIPNAFTPNGDGFNDVFQPVVCPVESYQLFIFNRWGEMIWTTEDRTEPWNGQVIGGSEVAQDEVYIYVLKLVIDGGNSKRITGSVTLLR
jgi:gliding motility-associated-like protein